MPDFTPVTPVTPVTPDARAVATAALTGFVQQGPQPSGLTLRVDLLSDPREAHLAQAIATTAVRRWLTITRVVSAGLERRRFDRLEPAVQAVLAAGAAQLLFLPRLPDHAVVHEAVELIKRTQPKAAGLVNAVLRRVLLMRSERRDTSWEPDGMSLPTDDGLLRLNQPLMEDPFEHACSLPQRVADAWTAAYGLERAVAMAHHAALTPVTWCVDEQGAFHRGVEDVPAFLAQHRARRVQDPTAFLAVELTRGLAPRRILDRCAGRGTKTVQLLHTHPDAQVWATDPHGARFEQLRQRVGDVAVERVPEGLFDLILLDVPCSNSGVFARRPEARYRYSRSTVRDLVRLQRQILADALPRLAPGGHLLYSTCSVDAAENQQQIAPLGLTLVQERVTLPSPPGEPYHDGGYAALLKRSG